MKRCAPTQTPQKTATFMIFAGPERICGEPAFRTARGAAIQHEALTVCADDSWINNGDVDAEAEAELGAWFGEGDPGNTEAGDPIEQHRRDLRHTKGSEASTPPSHL